MNFEIFWDFWVLLCVQGFKNGFSQEKQNLKEQTLTDGGNHARYKKIRYRIYIRERFLLHWIWWRSYDRSPARGSQHSWCYRRYQEDALGWCENHWLDQESPTRRGQKWKRNAGTTTWKLNQIKNNLSYLGTFKDREKLTTLLYQHPIESWSKFKHRKLRCKYVMWSKSRIYSLQIKVHQSYLFFSRYPVNDFWQTSNCSRRWGSNWPIVSSPTQHWTTFGVSCARVIIFTHDLSMFWKRFASWK